ncbi:beta,beta-carotene 15,15'-dioxygenase-like [Xyrauchen texanus]|uniref:beta,beta-carotene 15,15'-dioxygenase-like n=1 Tax=Xyrauchen texanus TaxID=154827 RepID=UPI00224272DC|nr:beta,beta-carotene 15,15'-dioxygenase-like [Xyrauchen texanus]
MVPISAEFAVGRNGNKTTSGSIPPWLQGALLRNGPGRFSVGDASYKHWFDGMAFIHSFTFNSGDVFYRSKFFKNETYKKNAVANRIVVSEFGSMVFPDPCKNIFAKTFSHLQNTFPDFTDNNLINIIRYVAAYYASSEVKCINQIDTITLDTLGRTNYRNHIALNVATAHPHYDADGNTHNMGTAIMSFGRPKYVIFKVPASASDKGKKPALSEVEQICSIPTNVINKCMNVIHLVNRKTGKTVSTMYITDAFAVFHHINAYEEDGHVVFDLITYQDSNLYDMFYLKNMKQDVDKFMYTNKDYSQPTCQWFVLPVNIGKVKNGI